MPKKKALPKDSTTKTFIKSGGRKGAEKDFNDLLKRAVKPKPSSTLPKAKKSQ